MSRRSDRLLAVGYYGEDPNKSYRETAVKVFRRRRRSSAGAHGSSSGSSTGSLISRASRNHQHLDTSYRSDDGVEAQGTSGSTLSESHGNGANIHATESIAPFYLHVTLILLLAFGLWFSVTSQRAVTPNDSASEAFHAEAEEFMTQILQDFEIKLHHAVSEMENRFQTKMLQVEDEIYNSLGVLQRQQLRQDQEVVQLGRASLFMNQQLWVRLADQGHSLTKLDRRCGHPVADGMADFALESQGGRVLTHLTSPSYQYTASSLWSLTSCFRQKSPETVIQGQPELLPGQCWAFAGGMGHMVISLSHSINISHVTLDHIASHKTPSGRIDSAPKNILVYGMAGCQENTEGTLLGSFVYDENGEPSQTFTLHDSDPGVFKLVKLVVQTNWGHPDYTCLYRFRVHGRIASY